MKKIFLTGATGVMGGEGLKELFASPYDYEVTVLARNTKRNHKKLNKYIAQGLKVIWGDLLEFDKIKEGVNDADIVLHVGGMVSPLADWYPQKTVDVNIGAMKNIIMAAKESNPNTKVVYIGSVAQYGNYEVPFHWGECSDILAPAKFDAYAYSKVEAERLLANSGLRYWVSLRQTGILHWGLLMKAQDPIAFHVPIKGVLEWVTAEDSGRLLERVCRDNVPDSFWRKFYNIGGGKDFRLTNYEFENMLMKSMGCPAPEKVFESNWFATQNFHGCWYKDSDLLEDILHFREGISPKQYFKEMKSKLPWFFKLAPLAPAFLIKNFMKRVANTKVLGPMRWIKENNHDRIDAAFGSKEGWENIPDWDHIDLSRPDDIPPEPHSTVEYTLEAIDDTVRERGGEILEISEPIDENVPIKIRCCNGHDFYLTPNALIEGGHWCGECHKINLGVKIN